MSQDDRLTEIEERQSRTIRTINEAWKDLVVLSQDYKATKWLLSALAGGDRLLTTPSLASSSDTPRGSVLREIWVCKKHSEADLYD